LVEPVGFDLAAVVDPMGLKVGSQLWIVEAGDHELAFGLLPGLVVEQAEIQIPGCLLVGRPEHRGFFGGMASDGVDGCFFQTEDTIRFHDHALNPVARKQLPEAAVGDLLDRGTAEKDRFEQNDRKKDQKIITQ
jgi:hypothetical protein